MKVLFDGLPFQPIVSPIICLTYRCDHSFLLLKLLYWMMIDITDGMRYFRSEINRKQAQLEDMYQQTELLTVSRQAALDIAAAAPPLPPIAPIVTPPQQQLQPSQVSIISESDTKLIAIIKSKGTQFNERLTQSLQKLVDACMHPSQCACEQFIPLNAAATPTVSSEWAPPSLPPMTLTDLSLDNILGDKSCNAIVFGGNFTNRNNLNPSRGKHGSSGSSTEPAALRLAVKFIYNIYSQDMSTRSFRGQWWRDALLLTGRLPTDLQAPAELKSTTIRPLPPHPNIGQVMASFGATIPDQQRRLATNRGIDDYLLTQRTLCVVMKRYSFTLKQLRECRYNSLQLKSVVQLPPYLFDECEVLHIAFGIANGIRHLYMNGFAHRCSFKLCLALSCMTDQCG
jgi:hypothetical protein